MIVRWFKKDYKNRIFNKRFELKKLILKSLLSSSFFESYNKIYFNKFFRKFNKFSSVSFYRRSCLLTGNARSVSRKFKLVRHQCKFFASNGLLTGLRKSSF